MFHGQWEAEQPNANQYVDGVENSLRHSRLAYNYIFVSSVVMLYVLEE